MVLSLTHLFLHHSLHRFLHLHPVRRLLLRCSILRRVHPLPLCKGGLYFGRLTEQSPLTSQSKLPPGEAMAFTQETLSLPQIITSCSRARSDLGCVNDEKPFVSVEGSQPRRMRGGGRAEEINAHRTCFYRIRHEGAVRSRSPRCCVGQSLSGPGPIFFPPQTERLNHPPDPTRIQIMMKASNIFIASC